MHNFIRETKEDQKAVFEGVGQIKHMSPAIVEKDFWVVYLLEYLFDQFKYKDYLCFKGGTSLSKSYNYIERFSEDIDLAIDWTLMGYGKEEPYKLKSRTKMDNFTKDIAIKSVDLIENVFLPIIEEDLQELLKLEFYLELDELDKQIILFGYPRQFEDAAILQEIRIEFGALAENIPSDQTTVSTYIHDVNPNLFSDNKISVLSLSPVRTLFEKLLILHREYHRVERSDYDRYSRHYYDVYQMLSKGLEKEVLNNLGVLFSVVEFNNRFYRYSWAKYNEILEGKIRLVPSNEKINHLKKDYHAMKTMIFGEVPEFSNFIDKLLHFEYRLNKEIIKFNNSKIRKEETL